MRGIIKYFFGSALNKYLAYITATIFLTAIGVGIHRIFFEGNYTHFYWKGFDPVSLFFGAFVFFISIVITLGIHKNTTEQNELQEKENKIKQKELESGNSYIKQKTDEIQSDINALLKQYQNIEVVSKFEDVMKELENLYTTTIKAQQGAIEYNGTKSDTDMQLKIMNHTASFGRLLCSDVDVIKSYASDFNAVAQDKDKLKQQLEDIRRRQKNVYNKMKEAFTSITDNNNKFYITLSASKDINGKVTDNIWKTAYNEKYLSKLDVENQTSLVSDFKPDKKFIQKADGLSTFSEYLIVQKQKKQIEELIKICEVYDAYSFNIPFQAFATLPVDENILNEKFYRCIFFFINDNTIGKGLQLSAICTSNISFVKSISKALDAEKAILKPFKSEQ